MRWLARLCRPALLAAGLIAAGLTTPAAAEIRLSIPQARQMAVQMAQAGQPHAAIAAARALLERDPDDVVALIVLSRAARDLGQYATAADAARHAWRVAGKVSERDSDRFAAALAMAQALASDGRRTSAQFWLRRAAQAAPDARSRAVAERDFRYVRGRNPWRAALSFGAFPSSNVNGGPTTNTFVFGGLEFVNPDAVPLSGFGFTTSADLSWRLDTGEHSAVTFGFGAEATRYVLSDAARRQVPDARASDYDSSTISASLGYARSAGTATLSGTLAVGRDWQGGTALADWRRLSLGWQAPAAGSGRLKLGLALEDTTRLDAAIRSSQRAELRLGRVWQLGSGDRVEGGLSLGRVWSDAASIARREGEMSLNWQKARPVLGVGLSAFASLSLDLYDTPLYGADPRRDVTARLGLSALLTKIDYMGFAPEVGVTLSRTSSNISAMTTEKAELHFGIRSTF